MRCTLKLLQIVDDNEIGPVTRRDRAMIFQSIMSRRVDRAHLNRGDRRNTMRDRFANRVIDVAFVHEIAGEFVVCRE